jgi:hypothetical protein
MNMPGFTAEAAIYRTSSQYTASYMARHPGSGLNNSLVISPQACSFGRNILCNGWILGCIGCTAFFPSVPGMIACYAACMGSMFAYCRNCLDFIDIPENSNGSGGVSGGGGPPAGGTCFPNKCCEWGENGECTLCIPRNAACP